MKPKYILLVFILLFTACKRETCTVSCGGGTIYYLMIGYTKAELVGTIMTIRSGGHQFDDTINASRIFYTSADSTGDTLWCSGMSISHSIAENVAIYIPSVNVRHNLSDFKLSGNTTQQVVCHEGGHYSSQPVGTPCNGWPYLVSYNLDGNIVVPAHFSNTSYDTSGLIYLLR